MKKKNWRTCSGWISLIPGLVLVPSSELTLPWADWGAIPTSSSRMPSRTDEPLGAWILSGRFARSDFVLGARPPRGCCCGQGSASEGPGNPPSRSSLLAFALLSRKGSESARLIRRVRPLTSVLLRFRPAEAAASWSRGSCVVRQGLRNRGLR